MKILGVFGFIFGLGVFAFGTYGFIQELDNASSIGTSAVIILWITAFSILIFVFNTFNRKKIYGHYPATDDILDLPDHIAEDQKENGVSGFIIGCGVVSMVATALTILISIYILYGAVLRFRYGLDFFRMENMIVIGFLISSSCYIIYCIRKLFFSRK